MVVHDMILYVILLIYNLNIIILILNEVLNFCESSFAGEIMSSGDYFITIEYFAVFKQMQM